MTENGPIEPETNDSRDPGQGGARRTRGIRFSDSEWEEVKKAAEKHDVPAGKLVRDTVLDLASGRTGAASGVPARSRRPSRGRLPRRIHPFDPEA